ncbi:MAG: hypothetical protein FJ315_00855 [SAR202 cluster bacterium]|nr:hypothetical protein [SAR202 cluster bacterium]
MARPESKSVDVKKLAGGERGWRVRVGSWRLIVDIVSERRTINVLRVLRRREAYRR